MSWSKVRLKLYGNVFVCCAKVIVDSRLICDLVACSWVSSELDGYINVGLGSGTRSKHERSKITCLHIDLLLACLPLEENPRQSFPEHTKPPFALFFTWQNPNGLLAVAWPTTTNEYWPLDFAVFQAEKPEVVVVVDKAAVVPVASLNAERPDLNSNGFRTCFHSFGWGLKLSTNIEATHGTSLRFGAKCHDHAETFLD